MDYTSNFDPQEIEKFGQMAANWWDLEGEFKPLHQINPLRLNFIQEHCDGVFGLNMLDVGCGGGILSESLAKNGAKVTGLDMSEDALQVAKLHALESGVSVDYRHSTIEDLASSCSESFDIVTCMEMLEHVPDPQSVVNACYQLVKPGGLVFFSTLNRNVKAYLMAIVAAEKVLKWVPEGTHEWDKFIKPAELLSWASSCGLIVKDMTGLHYNVLTSSYYLSNSNVDVNYMVCCHKDLD